MLKKRITVFFHFVGISITLFYFVNLNVYKYFMKYINNRIYAYDLPILMHSIWLIFSFFNIYRHAIFFKTIKQPNFLDKVSEF